MAKSSGIPHSPSRSSALPKAGWAVSTANGIAVFMLFGAGLTAGLLGQIAEALPSETLLDVSRGASWVLPFEALYQSALSSITADTVGFTRYAIDLGPFGGAQSFGALLGPYTVAYAAAVGAQKINGANRSHAPTNPLAQDAHARRGERDSTARMITRAPPIVSFHIIAVLR